MGDIFNYPLYNFTWSQSIYTVGGYFWIYFWCYFVEVILNKKFGEKFYRFFNGASMWGYVSHYLWIVFAVQLFVIKDVTYDDTPEKCNIKDCDNCVCNLKVTTHLNVFEAMAVIFLFTNLCIYVSYPILNSPYNYVSKKLFGKKKRNPDGMNSRKKSIEKI